MSFAVRLEIFINLHSPLIRFVWTYFRKAKGLNLVNFLCTA